MEAFLPWLYARYIYPYQEERVLGSAMSWISPSWTAI